jgi:hypothetical protein
MRQPSEVRRVGGQRPLDFMAAGGSKIVLCRTTLSSSLFFERTAD